MCYSLLSLWICWRAVIGSLHWNAYYNLGVLFPCWHDNHGGRLNMRRRCSAAFAYRELLTVLGIQRIGRETCQQYLDSVEQTQLFDYTFLSFTLSPYISLPHLHSTFIHHIIIISSCFLFSTLCLSSTSHHVKYVTVSIIFTYCTVILPLGFYCRIIKTWVTKNIR